MAIAITLNGKKETLDGSMSVANLLTKRNIRPEVVTVEVNDQVVHRASFPSTVIKEGDRVEIVFYMGGGSRNQRGMKTTRNQRGTRRHAEQR